MVTIRPYTSSDYENLKALLEEAGLFAETWESPENLDSMLKSNPDGILVGLDGNQLVSSIFSTPYGTKVMFFFRLAVALTHRKQGIATQMLQAAEKNARDKGCIEVCLFADESNDELQQFYKKRDFVTSPAAYTCFWKEI